MTNETLEKVIVKSAAVCAKFLGLDVAYSVSLINDPSISQDGLFAPNTNEIRINIAKLQPYPQSSVPLSPNSTEEERQQNEDLRLALSATYIIFHEIRHLYQKRAVEIYAINRMTGGQMFPPLESAKKCALWEQELKEYKLGDGRVWDLEEDADAFAEYLIHRYPVKIEMKDTNRRMGALKRKYNKVKIESKPEAPDESFPPSPPSGPPAPHSGAPGSCSGQSQQSVGPCGPNPK